MQTLSVVIITFNEEKNIGRCIDSVKEVADEIIVLDSYSTDTTIDIARGKGATVHQQKFKGYGQQKNDAIQFCSHDLILSLDADEALSSFLIKEILEEKKSALYDAYLMNRCTNYCGKFIRHGSWYPDRKIRLFKRQMAKWNNATIHEKIEADPQARIKQLKSDILHYSFNSIEEHVAQNNKFSTISAETLHSNGRRTNLFKIIVNPLWAFMLSYILRIGFADGLYGFIIAVNISHLTFLKHTKLMILQHRKN
jgi:glycosyltransferase involved in cell wall biosynthesis